MKILLAIDGSLHGETAAAEIVRQLFPAGCEVRVISVVEPQYVPEAFSGAGVNVPVYVEVEKRAREQAAAALAGAADKLRGEAGNRHCSVTTAVLSGSAKAVILEDAETFGADLIVVGSHGLEHKVAVRVIGGWLPEIAAESQRPSSWASHRIAPRGKH